jgi:hypothetical protein
LKLRPLVAGALEEDERAHVEGEVVGVLGREGGREGGGGGLSMEGKRRGRKGGRGGVGLKAYLP